MGGGIAAGPEGATGGGAAPGSGGIAPSSGGGPPIGGGAPAMEGGAPRGEGVGDPKPGGAPMAPRPGGAPREGIGPSSGPPADEGGGPSGPEGLCWLDESAGGALSGAGPPPKEGGPIGGPSGAGPGGAPAGRGAPRGGGGCSRGGAPRGGGRPAAPRPCRSVPQPRQNRTSSGFSLPHRGQVMFTEVLPTPPSFAAPPRASRSGAQLPTAPRGMSSLGVSGGAPACASAAARVVLAVWKPSRPGVRRGASASSCSA